MSDFFDEKPKLSALFNGKNFILYENSKPIASFPAFSGKNIPVDTLGYLPDAYDIRPGEVFMNNPKWTDIPYAGSIPEGNYEIGAVQENINPPTDAPAIKQNLAKYISSALVSKFNENRSSWGNFRMPISPLNKSNRTGLFLHGGSAPGSNGCIDLLDNMDSLVSLLESKNFNAPLPLKVKYED